MNRLSVPGGLAVLGLLCALLVACSDVPATNPYDPSTPAAQQARGTLRAALLSPAGFAASEGGQARIVRQDAPEDSRTVDLIRAEADGRVRLTLEVTDLPAGPYLLSAAVATLAPLEARPFVMPRGADLDLGEIALAAPADPAAFGEIAGVVLRQGAAEGRHGGTVVRTEGAPWTAVSADDGAFHLAAPTGSYRVLFSAPGYGGAALDTVGVLAGETTTLAEPVVIVAQPGTIAGAVLLPPGDDTPDRYGAVALALTPAGEVGAEPLARATATPEGEFVFADVAPGAWQVTAVLEGYTAARERVEVAPGDTAVVGPLVLTRSAEGAVVTGRVVLAGAAEGAHGGTLVEVVETADATVTNGDGNFMLHTLPGVHTLQFSHAGYLAQTAVTPALVAGRALALESDVLLPARPAVVSGRVTLPAGFDAAPRLPRVRVVATADDAGAALPVEPAIPDATGAFLFEALPPGAWHFVATLPGFTAEPTAGAPDPGGRLDLGELRLTFAAAEPPTTGVRGVVRLSDVPGDAGHGDVQVAAVGTPLSTVTDPAGGFTLGLPPEPATLVFSRPGYDPVERAVAGPAAGEVSPLDAPVLLAARPGRLRGLVALPADYADAERLARVEVSAVRLGDDAANPVDLPVLHPAADGGFLFDAVPPGRWLVRAVLPDWGLSASDQLRVAPGAEAEARVLEIPSPDVAPDGSARPPTRLEGRVQRGDVLDAAGHGGIVVEALQTPHATVTTGEGRFVLEVPPEPLTLRFSAPGYGTVTLEVARPAPELTTPLGQEVVLAGRPGALEGTATLTRFGTPEALADVTVRVLNAAGGLTAQTTPGADGRFVVSDVAAGAYDVEVAHPGYVTERRGVVVDHGETTRLGDIALRHVSDTPAAVPFVGHVDLGGDESPAGTLVRVRFADRDVALGQALTAPDGRFELPAAPDDRYTVRVERAGYASLGPVGPYHAVRGAAPGSFTWVDDAGNPPDLTLVADDLNGRIDVTFTVEPAWLPAPLRVADVVLRGARSSWPRPGIAGVPGATFDGLAAGAYTAVVSKPGFEGFDAADVLRLGHDTAAFDGTVRLVDLAAARLPLQGVTIEGAELAGIELRGADLSGVVLRGSLAGQDLTGANLSNADLAGMDFTGAVLNGARFFGADLNGAHFTNAHLVGAQLVSADLTGAHLQGADLTAANLSGATLFGADFAPDAGPIADPPCAPFPDAPDVKLTAALFSGADLRNAHLRGVALPGVDFSGALLAGANLRATCLTRAAFTLTDLSGAHLDGADARGAAFANAVANGVFLAGADLHGARLAGAVLGAADLACRDRTLAGTCACPPAPARNAAAPAEDVVAGAPPRVAGAACRTDLSDASLDGAALIDAELSGAAASGASFLGAVLSHTRMDDADLDRAVFAGVNLGDTSLRRAHLNEARLAGAQLTPETDLVGALLTGADLSASSAAGADLRGLDLSGVDLSFADLSGADLRGTQLTGARLFGTDVTAAYLAGADLTSVRLFNTELDETADLGPPPGRTFGPPLHLAGADLSGRWDVGFVSLHPGSDLDGVTIGEGAAMTLAPAGLIGVSLRGAVFAGDAVGGVPIRARDGGRVRFRSVDLTGADLELDLDAGLDLERVTAPDLTLRMRHTADFDGEVTALLAGPWACNRTDAGLTPDRFAVNIEGSDLTNLRWFGGARGLRVRQSTLDAAVFDALGAAGDAVAGWDFAETTAAGLNLGEIPRLSDASLRRMSLRGLVAPDTMTNVRFFQDDLRGADFSARELTGVTLRTSDLRNARFDRAAFVGSCLDKTQNGGASLAGATLTNTTLRQQDLRGFDLTGARMVGGMTCETFPADRVGALFPQGPGLPVLGSGQPPWCGANERSGGVQALGPTSCYEGVGSPNVQCWSLQADRPSTYRYTNATRYAVQQTPMIREIFQSAQGLNAIELVHVAGPTTPGMDGLYTDHLMVNDPIPTDETARAATAAAARLDTAGVYGRHWAANSLQPITHWSFHGTVIGQSSFPAGAAYSDMDFSDLVPGVITGPGQGGTLGFERARFTASSADVLGQNRARISAANVLVEGARWAGRVFPGASFTGVTLVGADLGGSSLPGMQLERVALRGADLEGANLVGVRITDTDLSGANLRGVSFAEASLAPVPTTREAIGPVNLKGVDLTGSSLGQLDLSEALVDADTVLTGVTMAGARLPAALRGLTLDAVVLAGLGWSGQDLRGLSLVGTTVTGAEWNDAVLVDADLRQTVLTDVGALRLLALRADLRGARLTDCRLREARFDAADLRDAVFVRVDLAGAHFTGADLRGATLPAAEFIGPDARFDAAHLCFSDLGALTPEQASVVVVDRGC